MKIGLVVEGGGMKCAYSAGILDQFLEYNINFDYAIGVSAGSANLASFLAGQKGRNKRFYTEHLKDPYYFGFKSYIKSGDVFNIKYIYGNLTNSNGLDPLDYDTVIDNPCEYKIVATNAHTGCAEYFDKKDLVKDDYRHFMASSCLPVICHPIEINGIKYYDGGMSDSLPVKKALEDGCDKIVVIQSKPRGYIRKPQKFKLLYSIKCIKYPSIVECLNQRHIMYNNQEQDVLRLEKQGKAFLFMPSNPPKMSTYTMDSVIEEQLYNLGVNDFLANQNQLEKFLR